MSLKDIPASLNIDSEEDLRTLVFSYCSELGFDRDELSCEESFSISLGHRIVSIGKEMVNGRSDLLISRNSRALAIIETKAPSHHLTNEDAQQAISYARLLSAIAPFAIVTNGKETRVYDVLADGFSRIDNPQESRWNQNGQQIIGINDDLRFEATKLLVGLNPDALSKFCKNQVATSLIDLKSNVKQNKKYIPDVYVDRQFLDRSYKEWLQTDLPIFAVVAPSGYGKTNFMCATAEEATSTNFVLFYAASRFTCGLLAGIRDDFIWEFHRDRETAQIFERLQTIAKQAGRHLLIFVDGIDENPSGIKTIKNELLGLAGRMQQYPNIKLVLSCKSFEWPQLVTDNAQSYNLLAETITPAISHPDKRLITTNAEKVGFHLAEFTNEELDEAIARYKSAYSVEGDFRSDLRVESHNPLMLRFIAEVYGGTGESLPATISRLELFNLYLERKLQPTESQDFAEIILSTVATQVLTYGNRRMPKNLILSELSWNEGFNRALHGLLRMGVLNISSIEHQEYIGFEFHRFLLYFYAFKVLKLQTLPLGEQVRTFQELVQSPIGIEVLDFYLAAVDPRVGQNVLTSLADLDLPLVAQILTGLKDVERYQKSPIPFDHVLLYLEFYNFLRDGFFARFSLATMPYTTERLGVIFLGDHHAQFRACTAPYPQPVVNVEDNGLLRQFFKGPLPEQVIRNLMPVGALHIGGIHEFAKHPSKAAYEHLIREVSSALSNRLLNEAGSNDILRERVWAVLLHEPSIWMGGDDLPARRRYWELMGFKCIEELGQAKVTEVIKRVNVLLDQFRSHLKKDDSLFPSYLSRSRSLIATLYALYQLEDQESALGFPQYSLDVLWGRSKGGMDAFIYELRNLVPIIMRNYRLLFASNLPSFVNWSHILPNVEKLALVEVTRSSGLSDFSALSYVVCPSLNDHPSLKIVQSTEHHSLTENLNFKRLNGNGYSQAFDHRCGYTEIDTIVDNVRIYESEGWVIKTRFPSRTPILDQVYSLIAHELEYIFNPQHLNWKYDQSSRLENDEYVRLATKYIIDHQSNGA